MRDTVEGPSTLTWGQLEFQQIQIAGRRIWPGQVDTRGDSCQIEGNIYLQKFGFKNGTSMFRDAVRCSILGCAEVLGTKARIQLELGLGAKAWPNGTRQGEIIGTKGSKSDSN